MKILILGGGGMLGHKLVEVLNRQHDVYTTLRTGKVEYAPLDWVRPENIYDFFDAEDTGQVKKLIIDLKPDVIINAVGILKQHETMQNERLVRRINSELPQELFELSAQTGSRLICISTDCVFSGEKGGYVETDLPDAFDLYGRTKAAGEIDGPNALTIRTSIIGRELKGATGLVEWFLAQRGETVKGYTRAVFSGFPTIILSGILAAIIEDYPKLEGIYHVAAAPIDKFSLLRLVNEAFDTKIEIEPFSDYEIDRSLNGRHFEQQTGLRAPAWPVMIEKMARDAVSYDELRKSLKIRPTDS